MSIFGVPVEGGGVSTILRLVRERDKGFWIITLNPEIALLASADDEYRETLRRADYRTIDGMGLYLFVRYILRRKCERLTGVALAEGLLAEAEEAGWSVGMIGGSTRFPDSLERAKQHILLSFPKLRIYSEIGGNITFEGLEDSDGRDARKRMQSFSPDILFVAFGHPKQERWIERYKEYFPDLKIIVGIGGTFDFWAGNVSRAPRFMRKIGLEWLWRLFQDPSRFKRIYRAVIIFPIFAMIDFFKRR